MNPVLFISHGAPNLLLRNTPHGAFLQDLGQSLPRPESVIVLSAHWYADKLLVGGAPHPSTIHDFAGFPQTLNERKYAVAGNPELARQICTHLIETGIRAEFEPSRGLDHGVWTALSLMYPDADVSVVPVAMPFRWAPSTLMRLGRVLGELRDDKTMIIASGGLVHNLRQLGRPDQPPEEWASAFAGWMLRALGEDRRDDADRYRALAPYADVAHPTEDHLLPLFVAWGAAGGGGEPLYEGFDYGNLGMHAVAFWD